MDNTTKAWEQYQAGIEYKRRIGLYNAVRENERFYRGDQWNGVNSAGLPTPVFNIIKRIVTYMISTATAQPVSVSYSDDSLPVVGDEGTRQAISNGVDLLNKNAAYRMDKDKIQTLIRDALKDAAISGDGVFYTYWDPDVKTGQDYTGDLKTVLCDNTDLFVSNVNSRDLQSQDYVMLSGRDTVSHLREEAEKNGLSKKQIEKITPDAQEGTGAGEMFDIESENEEYATFLLKFSRDESGCVVWEKSTKGVVIKTCATTMHRYPVAYFAWDGTKGSFIGNSPITAMIPNQKYINKAYAMVMKHMTDTAFSKVVYDKTLISEWTNEVGEAIGVKGGDVREAAAVVGVGNMQSGFLDVINMTMAHTKELMGATDAALGEVDPDNTSAILALQESSNIPLENLRQNLYACVEDLALNWADMIFEYYPTERLLPFSDEEGNGASGTLPPKEAFKNSLLKARVDVGAGTKYSQIVSVNTLDKLLAGGFIAIEDYLERLPDGIISDKKSLTEKIKAEKALAREQKGQVSEDGTAIPADTTDALRAESTFE